MYTDKQHTHLSKLKHLSHSLFIIMLLSTSVALADGTVECNEGTGLNSTECGISSSASGGQSVSIGFQSSAMGINSSAFGSSSSAMGSYSTATGYASRAVGVRSSAFGIGASANSSNGISIGNSAGYNSNTPVTDSPHAIAIGSVSNIGPASPGAIAIGGNANTSGRGAEATAPGAIALGADVVNDVPNSMLINVPLRIEGANPLVNALYLTPNTLGIGTPTPAKTVHIVKSDGTGSMRIEENSPTVQKRYQMQLENNGPTGFKFTDNANGQVWQFSQTPAGGFTFANIANGGQDFVMNSDGRVLMGPGPVTNFNLAPDGDLDIPNGSVTATTFNSTSSRTSKTDFTKINTDKIMENIKAMEVTEWRYKDENTKGRHIGPMAEDFYAMFRLGPDDKHVAATDMASIALIAAKELQKKSDAISDENIKLKLQLEAQSKRLAQLENLVLNLASGQNILPSIGNKVVFNR